MSAGVTDGFLRGTTARLHDDTYSPGGTRFAMVRCGVCMVVLNSGHHYRDDVRHHAIRLAAEHNRDEHDEPFLFVTEANVIDGQGGWHRWQIDVVNQESGAMFTLIAPHDDAARKIVDVLEAP